MYIYFNRDAQFSVTKYIYFNRNAQCPKIIINATYCLSERIFELLTVQIYRLLDDYCSFGEVVLHVVKSSRRLFKLI